MSSSIIDKIKNHINIVDIISSYIDLQKKGKNYWGVCPFHPDSNPSMSVSPEKQLFKCFVCGKGGSVIDFVSEFEKIPYKKALQILAEKAGVEYHEKASEKPKYNEVQQRLINVLKEANNFFIYSLATEEGKHALDYANKRFLNAEIREKFNIGYAPSLGLIDYLRKKGFDDALLINASLMTERGKDFFHNRLMFGITNFYGDIIAFSGRNLDEDGPKYINSGESQVFNKSSILYNYFNAKDNIEKEKEIYINEGFMDTIALYRVRQYNSLALMGVALTQKHIPLLKDKSVVLMLDNDHAGREATLKTVKLLIFNNIKTYVITSNDGKDADEILNKIGPENFKKLLSFKDESLAFVFSSLRQKYNCSTVDGINEFIGEFSKFLSFASSLEKDFYLNKIAKEFNISKELIDAKIPNHKIEKIGPLPKPKTFNNEVKTTIKPNNVEEDSFVFKRNSYLLIRSMIKKPILIDVFKQNPVNFNDVMLNGIGKYLVEIRESKITSINPIFKEKVVEIMNESNRVLDSESEFRDMIKKVDRKTKDILMNTVNVKLNKVSSEEEKNSLLEQMIKIKKERGK